MIMNSIEKENVKLRLDGLKDRVNQFSSGKELYHRIEEDEEFCKEINFLSHTLLNEQLGSCPACRLDACVRLCKLTKKRVNEILSLRYRIKEGCVLYLEGKPITNYNLTNKIAVELLKDKNNDQWIELK